MMLVSVDYSPDRTQTYINNGTDHAVSVHEVSGTGYVPGFGQSGRKLLTGKSFVKNSGTHLVEFHFDAVSWVGLNLGLTQVGGAVLCVEIGSSDTTSLLVTFRSSGFPRRFPGQELRISPDTQGYFRF